MPRAITLSNEIFRVTACHACAGPAGFTDCCGGACINGTTTPCCQTTSGYVACSAGAICAADVFESEFGVCCAILTCFDSPMRE